MKVTDYPPPYLPEDVVQWLDNTFPERTPDADWPIDRIRVETGKREVVRFLRHKYEEQVAGSMQPPT